VADRFPDYDVLAKRDGPSWNDRTRAVVDTRLALTVDESVLGPLRTATLQAVVDRIVPQPQARPPVNAAAVLIEKIASDAGDGHRPERLPRVRQAWTIGLDAIEAEARTAKGSAFAQLAGAAADALLRRLENGTAVHPAWGPMPSQLFWRWRLLPDIVGAYFAHPSAWSAMGFGGPAAPRGYVRLDADRRDGWEAAEAGDGRLIGAAIRNRHAG
jgi:hypothetical protein